VSTRILILGAAGRDFHNFNVCYRGDPAVTVAAFTAAQIPNIANRRYPAELAGPRYPDGIPIVPEAGLADLISRLAIDQVAFAYSDVSYGHVMHLASVVLASGADFVLLGPRRTMLAARKRVVAVCAVRTGAGKSPVTRRVADIIRTAGLRPAVVRHPMPYGDLARQACQRFTSPDDLDRQACTIEEREEYEPHLARGLSVFAGVDTARVLATAEQEADVILWDGGNNDLPFVRPNLHIVVADALRPGHETAYYPGEANVLMADLVLISKVNTAPPDAVHAIRSTVSALNPRARILDVELRIVVDREERIRGRRALVVEDGPTLTHGGMASGAGLLAAQRLSASIVDPRPWARGSIADVYREYSHIGPVLPAMGYGERQLHDLEATIAAVPCDAVVCATPIDLGRVITVARPVARVTYEAHERPEGALAEAVLEAVR
jgi:predicted GTPase